MLLVADTRCQGGCVKHLVAKLDFVLQMKISNLWVLPVECRTDVAFCVGDLTMAALKRQTATH